MTTDTVGGIWTYALDLGRALAARGLSLTLATVGPEAGDCQRQAASEAGLDLIHLGAQPEWLVDRPDEVARGGRALADVARRTRADVIHLNHPALAAEVSFDVPVVAVCHSCVATWFAAVRGSELPDVLRWQADLVDRGYRAAAARVTPSRAFAAAMQQVYALPSRPSVVHNGRIAATAPSSARSAMWAFTAGRLWDEGKNVSTLDAAAGAMRWPVQAAGPVRGPNGAGIQLSHLDWLGALAEAGVRACLAERPVYVSAARYEPFGLSVLEAAQAGCALVLSDIGTFRELWGEAAIFVDPLDYCGFAAAVEGLLDDPERRTAHGEAARRAAAAYTVEACVDAMLTLYAHVTAAAPGNAPDLRAGGRVSVPGNAPSIDTGTIA